MDEKNEKPQIPTVSMFDQPVKDDLPVGIIVPEYDVIMLLLFIPTNLIKINKIK